MRDWDAAAIAAAAGAQLLRGAAGAGAGGPAAAAIDSRSLAPGELFVGLRGAHTDGGAHAAQALASGAWGVLAAPEHAAAAAGADTPGAVLAHPDPLASLQALASAWRERLRERGARVVAITGSTGKTSTKDILSALLAPQLPTCASPANLNTEIGVPLAILRAPSSTRALVLEMAMRGAGQIAELTSIARPDVGVIVNVGPAHLELLGSLAAIAAAKAELLAGLETGAGAVVPSHEPLLEPHVRADLRVLTFGAGGDVTLARAEPDGRIVVSDRGDEIELEPGFSQPHLLTDLLAAVAAARLIGVRPAGALEVSFGAMRGQRLELASGIAVIDDCYNANPMSMQAALQELARTAPGRRVAVLGDMLELGGAAQQMHRDVGAQAQACGVELLLAVGPLAAEMRSSFAAESHAAPDAQSAAELIGALVREGDTVLVKGSRGVGLERVVQRLREAAEAVAPGAGRR